MTMKCYLMFVKKQTLIEIVIVLKFPVNNFTFNTSEVDCLGQCRLTRYPNLTIALKRQETCMAFAHKDRTANDT